MDIYFPFKKKTNCAIIFNEVLGYDPYLIHVVAIEVFKTNLYLKVDSRVDNYFKFRLFIF